MHHLFHTAIDILIGTAFFFALIGSIPGYFIGRTVGRRKNRR